MKSFVRVCSLLLLFLSSSEDKTPQRSFFQRNVPTALLQPRNGNSESTNQQNRAHWIETMHQSAPGIDWRLQEYLNQKQAQTTSVLNRSNCGSLYFANSKIKGVWKERGSNNQAGSILDVTYLSQTDEIWAIADGGSLWKRSRLTNDWQVIRQDVRFNRGFLKFLNTNHQPRLLAFLNNWLHYSDDQGQNWIGTNESDQVNKFGGYFAHPVITQGPKSLIAYLSKPSSQSNIQLLYSLDGGTTVQHLSLFETANFDDFKLLSIPDQDEIWLLQRAPNGQLQVYQIDFQQKRLNLLNGHNSISAGDGPIEAQIKKIDQTVQLFFIQSQETEHNAQLFLSTDTGQQWKKQSTLPISPWAATYHISLDDPKYQYLGGVEAYRSKNDGKSWEIINYWWEYYQNIEYFLHADIMYIESFKTREGQPFTLIANHGGLSISYNHFNQKENLGLQGLHVSQYYSVRTNPSDPTLIYAGSQDQGLQATFNHAKDSILNFDQLSPGDYGHLSFSKNGQSLWAAYPGSSVFYIEDVYQGYTTATYNLEAKNETVWLAPIHLSPFHRDKAVYMAGGSPNENSGSYVIKLTYEGGAISAQGGQKDFFEASQGGTISAIELSMTDSSYWYLATTNGHFFYSQDAGQSWEESQNFLPTGSALYGQVIKASEQNPKVVYLAGSGYSNPAVYFSEDGGHTFKANNQGLPPTLVYDIAFNDTEELLFAATEAGPFVLVIEDQRWYPLSNNCTPNQAYWSVEYLASEQLVRYGTYGRGIWDLQIEGLLISNLKKSITITPLRVFPNPSHGVFRLNLEQAGPYQLRNTNGRLIQNGFLEGGPQQLNLTNLPNGTYFLQIQQGDELLNSRLLLIH